MILNFKKVVLKLLLNKALYSVEEYFKIIVYESKYVFYYSIKQYLKFL
jgi:hypothetical protein